MDSGFRRNDEMGEGRRAGFKPAPTKGGERCSSHKADGENLLLYVLLQRFNVGIYPKSRPIGYPFNFYLLIYEKGYRLA